MSMALETPVSLPQELIDKIIDELPTASSIGALRPESRAALVSCSLVSHSFRPRTIHYLFRRFNPANTYPVLESSGWERLDQMLSKSPHIVRAVTCIVLDNRGGPLRSSRAQAVHAMSLLVHVKRVEIRDIALDHWNPLVSRIFAGKPITQVLLAHVPFHSFNNFVACVAICFPDVHNLALAGGNLDANFPRLALTSEFQADVTVLRLPSLKTLSCSVSDMSKFFDGVADGTIEVKNLQSLKLSYVSMRPACFAPLLQKSPLKALEMANVDFQPARGMCPSPLPLRHLQTLYIKYTYLQWLCDSIPLGMSQLQTVTVRLSGKKPSALKVFNDLTTTYVPGLQVFRLEDYFKKSQGAIINDCAELVARGILQWGIKKQKMRSRTRVRGRPPRYHQEQQQEVEEADAELANSSDDD